MTNAAPCPAGVNSAMRPGYSVPVIALVLPLLKAEPREEGARHG
jgi:hypothetical protein